MKRALIILGVVLLVLGIAAVLHPTYTYHKREQVAKIGALQATLAAVLVSGLALVLIGSRLKP